MSEPSRWTKMLPSVSTTTDGWNEIADMIRAIEADARRAALTEAAERYWLDARDHGLPRDNGPGEQVIAWLRKLALLDDAGKPWRPCEHCGAATDHVPGCLKRSSLADEPYIVSRALKDVPR